MYWPGVPGWNSAACQGLPFAVSWLPLASLFDHLLECNAVAVAGGNPVHGVKRPKIESKEGKTPALGDHQAKALLEALDAASIKGKRDRAILAVLLYQGLCREEAARLGVTDLQERLGIKHLCVHGKGGKLRYLPLHPVAAVRIYAYLEASGHHLEHEKAPLFVPLRGRRTGIGMSANGIYAMVGEYARAAGIEVVGLGVHGPPPPPTLWRTRPTLPRCSNSWGTPTSVLRGSTIVGSIGRRIRRPSE